MKLKVEYLSPSELRPYSGNAKLHPAEQVEQIKKSIEQFGMNDPIAIWKENEIIEGHGRLLALMDFGEKKLKELGLEKIPVIRLDHLTDEQRRAYALVHNKLTMNTDFDAEILDLEIDNIVDIDMTEFGFLPDDDDEDTKTDISERVGEVFEVVVTCKTEDDQEALFMRLTEEGYECRLSTL